MTLLPPRQSRRLFVVAVGMAAAFPCSRSIRGQENVTLGAVLNRLQAYLVDYATHLPATIASEHYIQRSGSGPSYKQVMLDSDFGIVQLPGVTSWLGFRDVLLRNGQPVGDRTRRLDALFLNPPEDRLQQAQLIAQESASQNIGPVTRTINNPALVLELLDSRNAYRMRFDKAREGNLDGVHAWIIRFEEVARPTLVRSENASDAPSRGRAWVDPATGTLLRVEATVASGGPTGSFNCTTEVTFRLDPKMGFWVPARMDEEYLNPRFARVSSGQATYSNYRKFSVDTQESLGLKP